MGGRRFHREDIICMRCRQGEFHRTPLAKEQIPQIIETVTANRSTTTKQVIEGFDRAERSWEDRVVTIKTRWIMNPQTNRTKAILMP